MHAWCFGDYLYGLHIMDFFSANIWTRYGMCIGGDGLLVARCVYIWMFACAVSATSIITVQVAKYHSNVM